MAGIYFHIPFCRKACHYCDFHFSTSLQTKEAMLEAMRNEIILRAPELSGDKIETIYFGGGTPSLLSAADINRLINSIHDHFAVESTAEITLEANPDDLTPAFLKQLNDTVVNRLSIGLQSFYDDHLQWMNRAHSAGEAEAAIIHAQDAGFSNITIDLIYGFDLLSDEQWASNLDKVAQFRIPHFSAYALTVEEKTVLGNRVAKKLEDPVKDEHASGHFKMLSEFARAQGYRHYEISNFAVPGQEAKHNSAYWTGKPYLGIGPSAHSFIDPVRSWNVSNNALYIRQVTAGHSEREQEVLDHATRIREKVMTGLRLDTGLQAMDFDEFTWKGLLEKSSHLNQEWLDISTGSISLTTEGRLFADYIAVQLFPEEG